MKIKLILLIVILIVLINSCKFFNNVSIKNLNEKTKRVSCKINKHKIIDIQLVGDSSGGINKLIIYEEDSILFKEILLKEYLNVDNDNVCGFYKSLSIDKIQFYQIWGRRGYPVEVFENGDTSKTIKYYSYSNMIESITYSTNYIDSTAYYFNDGRFRGYLKYEKYESYKY